MKKAFLLILPALLALSACSAGPKKADDVLLEDTLAHEELFGEVGESLDLRVRRLENESEEPTRSLSAPAIGVQYLHENNKYAIRYVAAISDLSVTAVWTRNICQSNGTRLKTENSQIPVTTAYTALSAAGGVAVPESGYYVVYTVRNIPESDVNSYLFAYLTLTQGENSVKSLARVSRMGEGNTFTFDTASVNGCFIQGTIGGSANIVPINDAVTDGNIAQKTGLVFAANDSFGLFKYESGDNEHFQCFGYQNYRQCFPYVERVLDSNYTKILAAGNYSLYLNGSNEVHFIVPEGTKPASFYLKPNDDWKGDCYSVAPRFSLYVYNDTTNTNAWVSGSSIGNGIYKFEVASWTYEGLIFCRMDGREGHLENNWDNKVNQTGNLGTVNYCNQFNITSWDNGNWSF